MVICTFPGCGRQARAKGLCANHRRQQRQGNPLQPLMRRRARIPSLEARLLAHVEYDTNGWGCWLWSGGIYPSGYGQLDGDIPERAHRVAYRLWVGPIPKDKPNVCHHCDTPPCIRPDHLWAGTQAENIGDMARKGRGRKPRSPA